MAEVEGGVLQQRLASFETRPLGATQDGDKSMMALRKNVVLRSPRSGGLEGRTVLIQSG
jgi:hypothetical protein